MYILIILYLLSAYFYWLWVKIAHSKGGKYEIIEPDLNDLIILLLPIINTVVCFWSWIIDYPKTNINKKLSKFFNVKK